MSHGPYWPDANDQALVAYLMQEYPDLGPGMCFLFGAYRQAGVERLAAFDMAHEAIRSPQKNDRAKRSD